MSTDLTRPLHTERDLAPATEPRAWLGYAVALALVAAATVVAFVVDHLIRTPNLSLIYVLPVVIAALSFGFGPSLVAAVASVLVVDLLFIEPRYTLTVASPNDVMALALLLVIAALVSTVGAQSRRRALQAQAAADQAEALSALAHVVISEAPRAEVLRAAADALSQIFGAVPAVVLVEAAGGGLQTAAAAAGARLSPADQEASRAALESGRPTRADAYPVEQAEFDFWPVMGPAGARCVLGVRFPGGDKDRPEHPDRVAEVVGAYVATALKRTD
ncbi:MAG TPA: DUF4118 domain-containing protein [Caulobacteraceae bacterium]|nr:DUF4118 domain-containing protein [Caulobacteraceae bacterium]